MTEEAGAEVRLVPVDMTHAVNMCRWMLDPVVAENLGLRREASLEYTERWIEQAKRDSSIWAMAILHGGVHVGNVVFDRIDAYAGTARLSLYVGERTSRHAGVGQAALRLALDAAFGELGLQKVWGTLHSRNTASVRMLTAVGFQVEGVLRREFRLRGALVPALYMGLLREEHSGDGAER